MMATTSSQSTRTYAERHLLDFNEPVGDGFYDPGRGQPLRPIAEWRADKMSPNGREVVEVVSAR